MKEIIKLFFYLFSAKQKSLLYVACFGRNKILYDFHKYIYTSIKNKKEFKINNIIYSIFGTDKIKKIIVNYYEL